MKPLLRRTLVVMVVVGALAGLTIAFVVGHKEAASEAEREKPLKAPSRVQRVNGENVVAFDAAARSNSGVELATFQAASHREQIRAFGTVVDPTPLTDLRNTIETAKAQLNKANAALDVAQKDYERVKGLYDKNQNVSQKTVQAAEGALRAEQANAQTAQAALEATQATALQEWGKVIAHWLVRGAPDIERLSSQENLLLQVTLSPGRIVTNPPLEASVVSAEGRRVPVKFVSPALRTDPKIQGQSLFYTARADDGGLLPGMSIPALLPAGKMLDGVLVPLSAVVWLRGKPWIYVQVNPDRFARREVSTDQPVVDGWFQPQGFSPGETFVAKGPQALLSEEFRAQISVGEEGGGD
jgi:hypothetical protein